MKTIELFYLTDCPYCLNAAKAVDELKREDPSYGEIQIRWIEEREEAELADSRDYYHVPCLFYKGEKLYEANPAHTYAAIKKHIRKAFDTVLEERS